MSLETVVSHIHELLTGLLKTQWFIYTKKAFSSSTTGRILPKTFRLVFCRTSGGLLKIKLVKTLSAEELLKKKFIKVLEVLLSMKAALKFPIGCL